MTSVRSLLKFHNSFLEDPVTVYGVIFRYKENKKKPIDIEKLEILHRTIYNSTNPYTWGLLVASLPLHVITAFRIV